MRQTHKTWMSYTAYAAGVLALVSLPFRTINWGWWLLATLCLHLVFALVISVGVHRLFCHGSFKTSRFWHWFAGIGTVLAVYGSPIQWSIMHVSHHKYSDTDNDPHPLPGKWRTLFARGYRQTPMNVLSSKRLLLDPMHAMLHRNYAGLLLGVLLGIVILSPALFFNAYLPALGLLHLIASVHGVLAHKDGQPHNLALMEFLLPSGGEWLHKDHHDKPGAWRFGNWDMGAKVIAWIKL